MTTTGRYRVAERIASTAFARVHRGWDPLLERWVALKLPAQEARAAGEDLLAEARLLARFDHPGIIGVLDAGGTGADAWFATELVAGESLSRLARDDRGIGWAAALRAVTKLAEALDTLHAAGVVHGDVKAASVVLSACGRVVLVDLQVAALLAAVYAQGSTLGTPESMAPEQILPGEPPGPAADVYALAVLAYRLLAGRPPFAGDSASVLAAHLEAAPPGLGSLRPDLPPGLAAAVERGLAKRPADRPATAGAFALELERALRLARPAVAPAAAPATPLRPELPLPAQPQTEGPRWPTAPVARLEPITLAPAQGSRPGAASAGSDDTPRGTPALAAAEEQAEPATVAPRRPAPATPRFPVSSLPPGTPEGGNLVDCTLFAPPAVEAPSAFLVQAWLHLPTQAGQADSLAREFDDEAERRAVKSLAAELSHGDRLELALAMPGLEVDDPLQHVVWRGEPTSAQFGVTVPAGLAPRGVIGTLTASLDSVPLGHIKFKLKLLRASDAPRNTEPAPTGEVARRYRRAFISYASSDRGEVLKRVQMLARLRIGFFQDILDLEPGERWERALYREIDDADVFFLFWSSAARNSSWVMREVRHALARQGGNELSAPEIVPVIIEGPPRVEPPPELAHIHFNDRLLYLMATPPSGQSPRPSD